MTKKGQFKALPLDNWRRKAPIFASEGHKNDFKSFLKMTKNGHFGLCSLDFPKGNFTLKIEAVKPKIRTFVRIWATNRT